MTNYAFPTATITAPRECTGCKVHHTLTVSADAAREWNSPNRRKVQEIFPEMSADDREILLSGLCSSAWDALWDDEEE